MKRKLSIVLLPAVLFAAVLLWTGVLPIRAQSAAGVSGKLNEILQNQQEIITRLSEMSVELNKIRIRVSSR